MFELEVPLEQFYNGHTRRIRVTKTVICSKCDGAGGTGVSSCQTCQGRGARIVTRQVGPGMIQRMQMQCNACGGKGQVIPRGQRCTACNGQTTSKEAKTLSVFVEKGMRHGDKVTFNEEGDQHPDETPGDVVVVLKRKAHPVFKRTRDGCHLIVNKKISLIEALTGFDFKLEHLDGRILHIHSEEGAIYKTGDVKAIPEEGMPLKGNSSVRGHLYINLEVVYPDSLTKNQQKNLSKALGQSSIADYWETEVEDTDDVEGFQLEEVDIEAEKETYKKMLADNPSQYEEDEEEHGHGGQQTCRAQ